jgi:hypothetical protein
VPADQRLADLESALAQIKLDLAENAALVASLVDVPLPADRIPALSPEELRRRQLAALIMAGARVQAIKPPRRIWRGFDIEQNTNYVPFLFLYTRDTSWFAASSPTPWHSRPSPSFWR